MVSTKFGCFGWKVIFSNIAISISAAILILHCGLQWFSHGALALCTLTRRWGSNFWAMELQFCHPQIQGPHSSFLGVFFVGLFWGCVVFGFVLFRLWKTPGFLLFTCPRHEDCAENLVNREGKSQRMLAYPSLKAYPTLELWQPVCFNQPLSLVRLTILVVPEVQPLGYQFYSLSSIVEELMNSQWKSELDTDRTLRPCNRQMALWPSKMATHLHGSPYSL